MFASENISHKVTNQGHFNADKPTYRLTPAGPDHASVAACAGMVDYYEDIYHHHFPSGSENLRERLEKVLNCSENTRNNLWNHLLATFCQEKIFDLLERTQRAGSKEHQRLHFIPTQNQAKQFMTL